MPSLPASAVGCAIGIADADKLGIATIAQAARLIKSRRRMGSLLVRPRFSWRWMNAFKRGEFHEAKVARSGDGSVENPHDRAIAQRHALRHNPPFPLSALP